MVRTMVQQAADNAAAGTATVAGTGTGTGTGTGAEQAEAAPSEARHAWLKEARRLLLCCSPRHARRTAAPVQHAVFRGAGRACRVSQALPRVPPCLFPFHRRADGFRVASPCNLFLDAQRAARPPHCSQADPAEDGGAEPEMEPRAGVRPSHLKPDLKIGAPDASRKAPARSTLAARTKHRRASCCTAVARPSHRNP